MKYSTIIGPTMYAGITSAGIINVRQVPDSPGTGGACTSLELIYGKCTILLSGQQRGLTPVAPARGTGESFGANGLGESIAPPIYQSLSSAIGSVSPYGVDYPATLTCASRTEGSQLLSSHLTSQAAACPNQEFAVVGYSQGADVVHEGLAVISSSLYPRIIAIVLFGDPANRGPSGTYLDPLGKDAPGIPSGLTDKVMEVCGEGDPICTNNGTDFQVHASYGKTGTYVQDAAVYILRQYQSKGTIGPVAGANPGTQTAANQQVIEKFGGSLDCN